MPRLTLITADGQREIELTELVTLGRHDGCTITIHDGLMSKHHTKVFPQGGAWYAEDLGSTNGTFVNGIRTPIAELNNGDEITIGNTRAIFHADPAPAPAPEREVPKGVTIMADLPSFTRAKLGNDEHRGEFLPADQITDVEQLKLDYEKLRIANSLNQKIGLEAEIDELLPRILDETFKLIPADRGCILLKDASGNLVPRAVKRSARASGESDEEIVLSNTILTEVVQNLSAVLTSDAMMDDRFAGSQSIIAMSMRSTMCVPMVHKGQLLGVLHADSVSAVAAFSNKDLQILSGVAAQAAQAIDNAQKAKQLERNALARRDFERLLPPGIVEQVIAGKVKLERGGREQSTSILFSDIRGFTSWSERHEASYIVEVLNEYFELMVEAIHKHRGTLDKFMGDGIMAIFGAPVSHPNDALSAVSCAMEMMHMLRAFNARLAAKTNEQIEIGIGINTGQVVVGYMGSSKSMEYTAIGDHVNLSARLCGAALPGQILVSEPTYQNVAGAFRATQLAPIQVKGKSQPIPVYEIIEQPAPEAHARPRGDTGVHDVPFK